VLPHSSTPAILSKTRLRMRLCIKENRIGRPLPPAHEVPDLNVPDHEAVNEGAIV
jgi:predicted TIM-barrel fold metal-dependent hydrolase